MCKIINIYGGPGIGKSTSAAKLYTLFNYQNKSVELVQEFVKEWAYQNKIPQSYEQFYIFTQQVRREFLLWNKVDYIITDSPTALSPVYCDIYSKHRPIDSDNLECLIEMLKNYYKNCEANGVEHLHILLKRSNFEYSSTGRYSGLEESIEIDRKIKEFLDNIGITYFEVDSNEKSIENFFLTTFKTS